MITDCTWSTPYKILTHIPVKTTYSMLLADGQMDRLCSIVPNATEVPILTSINVLDNAARVEPATLDYFALCSYKIFYRLQLTIVRALCLFEPSEMVRYKMSLRKGSEGDIRE